MSDLISRQAAIDDILRRLDTLKMTEFGTGTFRDGVADGYARIISDLKSLPSAERHGRWIELYENNYKCSVCRSWWTCEEPPIESGMFYCPNCGARMEGEEE